MGREDSRYGIEELADLGGVSRRTVRYYVQEGLLPPPLGVGRAVIMPDHLDALLKVKGLQEAGRTLEEIRGVLSGKGLRAFAPAAAELPRSLWRRFVLAPGVELHVAGDVPLPPAAGLERLAEWSRVYLGRTGGYEHADD